MNNIIEIWNTLYPQFFALLVNTAWQVALLVTLIILSIFLLKIKSTAIHHVLWLLAVFSPLFLPLLNLYVPAVDIELFLRPHEQIVYEEKTVPQKYPATSTSNPQRRYADVETRFSERTLLPKKPGSLEKPGLYSSTSKEQPSVTTSESDFAFPLSLKEILLLLWLLGVLGMTARLVKGLHGLRSLRKSAVPVENHSTISLLDELRDSFGIRREIQLATSDKLTYPVSFGWLKPIILMPSNFTDTMSFDEIKMLFIHELAHFKRRDYLVNIISSFLRIPLFFHPLYIFAQKKLQIQQEHVCDDWVFQFDQSRTEYAQCLLRQAEVAVLKNVPSVGTSVISGFKNMKRRIDMILDKKRNLSINLSKKAVVFTLLICCLFTALAATTRLLPFAFAQQTEAEKMITKIKEARQSYPIDEKLSSKQQLAAYRKNSEKGLALCKQFLEKYPQHESAVKVLLDRVWFLGCLQRDNEADQLAQEFLEAHPKSPYADVFRWKLVSDYESKGKYEEALAELEMIKEPEWKVHWERYQIYLQTGRSIADNETEHFLCLQSIIGKPAPLFSAETIDGQKISLEELRGKVVLLNFRRGCSTWETYRVKKLKQLYDKYKNRKDFAIVSIATDANPEKLREYIRRNNIDWLHILDENDRDKSIAWRYGHRGNPNVSGNPAATYIIDKYGLIRDLSPVQPPDLIRFKGILETALAEDAKGPPPTEFASIHYAKARKLHIDKVDEKIREYETAIRLCPSAPSYWYASLAHSYRQKEMYERAIAMRLKEIESVPKDRDKYGLGLSHIRLAELYVEVGKNKEAVKALKKAIVLHPTAARTALESSVLQILKEEDEELQKFAAEREPERKQKAEHRKKEEAQWLKNLRRINSAIVELVIEPTDTFKEGIAGGVVIDEDGYIIACSEVADQKEIKVRVEKEDKVETYKAQVFSLSEELGIAWLKIDANGLILPPFADSDKVEPRKVSKSSVKPMEGLGVGIVRTPDGTIRKYPTGRYFIRKTLRNESGQAVKYLFGMVGRNPANTDIPCQVLATKQGEVFAIRIADSEHGVPQFVPINIVTVFTPLLKAGNEGFFYMPFRNPVNAPKGEFWFSSGFGWRKHPITGKKEFHSGIDIAAKRGTEVNATAAGEIISMEKTELLGNTIIIKHGSRYKTVYARLNAYGPGLKEGDKVGGGRIIGYVGDSGKYSTGTHLHYEVHVDGKPQDPMKYIIDLSKLLRP